MLLATHQRLAGCFTGCAKGSDSAPEWETDSVRGFAECVFQNRPARLSSLPGMSATSPVRPCPRSRRRSCLVSLHPHRKLATNRSESQSRRLIESCSHRREARKDFEVWSSAFTRSGKRSGALRSGDRLKAELQTLRPPSRHLAFFVRVAPGRLRRGATSSIKMELMWRGCSFWSVTITHDPFGDTKMKSGCGTRKRSPPLVRISYG